MFYESVFRRLNFVPLHNVHSYSGDITGDITGDLKLSATKMDFRLKIVILICLLSLLGDVNPVLGKKGGTKKQVKALQQSVSELKQQLDEQRGKMGELEEKLKEQEEKNKEQEEKIKAHEERIETLEECDACSKIAELNKTLHGPEEKNVNSLLFNGATTDYVMNDMNDMPSLTAFTACLWMKTSDAGHEGTPLSYALSEENTGNELLLFDYKNFRLFVGGLDSDYTSVSANDGEWHHICVTWENTAGSWKLYKDGALGASGSGLNPDYVISADGSLVLGQEQDTKGGGFDPSQSFIGEMTGVNIWDHVVLDEEIIRMSNSCVAGEGNVLKWSDFKQDDLKGTVKFIESSC